MTGPGGGRGESFPNSGIFIGKQWHYLSVRIQLKIINGSRERGSVRGCQIMIPRDGGGFSVRGHFIIDELPGVSCQEENQEEEGSDCCEWNVS